MIVRQFLQWSQQASPSQRADAARALAQTYLYADLDPVQRREADIALTGLLDDPSPLVRRGIAEAFASALDAPHHIVLALAEDQSDIASIVLARSPVLSDADLIDCAAVADACAQSAIALRPGLTAPVAAALAEIGAREALIALAVNAGADVPEFSMRRMVERFGEDGELREALLSRPYLPAALRADLVSATARALSAFVMSCDWLSEERAQRVAREAREKAHVLIAAAAEREENGPARLAAHLRASGQLTAGLALRALLSGNLSLFEATLAELSGVTTAKVAGHLRHARGAGFAALYRKAAMPQSLYPAFCAALEARAEFDAEEGAPALSRAMIDRVADVCSLTPGGAPEKLTALLRRLAAEAAREEARLLAPQLAQPDEPEVMLIDSDEDAVAPAIVIDPTLDDLSSLDLRGALDDAAPKIEILGKDEPIDPSLVLVRFEGQGGAMRAREVRIDFAAIEAELAAA